MVDISQLSAAVGANHDYYKARFNRIAASGRRWVPGWNWGAFWHSTAWFFHRRMYGLAALNFFAPWVLFFALMGASDLARQAKLDKTVMPAVAMVVLWTYLGCVFILVPLFANSIYFRHLLARVPTARPPSPWTVVGASALALAYFASFLVMLSSVSVDLGVSRAKVSGALMAAEPMRNEVTQFFGRHGRLPNAAEAQRFASDPSDWASSGVQSVAYDAGSGTIVLTMRDPFPGKRIAIRAVVERGQLVAWKCGPIDLEMRHLPGSCRESLRIE